MKKPPLKVPCNLCIWAYLEPEMGGSSAWGGLRPDACLSHQELGDTGQVISSTPLSGACHGVQERRSQLPLGSLRHVPVQSLITSSPWHQCYCYGHSMDEETEAQRHEWLTATEQLVKAGTKPHHHRSTNPPSGSPDACLSVSGTHLLEPFDMPTCNCIWSTKMAILCSPA